MIVNGIDIRKYNAKQLKVDLQPPAIQLNAEWLEGAATPHEFDTEVQYGTLKVTILFRGSGRSDIMRKVSEFLSLLTERSSIQLDGYKGTYIGDIKSDSIEKTKQPDRYILTVQFNGYMTDAEVSNVYKGVTEAKFTTLGTRDTPAVIEVLPQTDLQELVISGFGSDDIILTNLTKDKTVVIDARKGPVTEDGANQFADCAMWDFPVLKKKAVNNIAFSSSKCTVTIHYSPMWL